MVFFHIWGLNSCHLKVPHKLMLRVSHCGAPDWVVLCFMSFFVKPQKEHLVIDEVLPHPLHAQKLSLVREMADE